MCRSLGLVSARHVSKCRSPFIARCPNFNAPPSILRWDRWIALGAAQTRHLIRFQVAAYSHWAQQGNDRSKKIVDRRRIGLGWLKKYHKGGPSCLFSSFDRVAPRNSSSCGASANVKPNAMQLSHRGRSRRRHLLTWGPQIPTNPNPGARGLILPRLARPAGCCNVRTCSGGCPVALRQRNPPFSFFLLGSFAAELVLTGPLRANAVASQPIRGRPLPVFAHAAPPIDHDRSPNHTPGAVLAPRSPPRPPTTLLQDFFSNPPQCVCSLSSLPSPWRPPSCAPPCLSPARAAPPCGKSTVGCIAWDGWVVGVWCECSSRPGGWIGLAAGPELEQRDGDVAPQDIDGGLHPDQCITHTHTPLPSRYPPTA